MFLYSILGVLSFALLISQQLAYLICLISASSRLVKLPNLLKLIVASLLRPVPWFVILSYSA